MHLWAAGLWFEGGYSAPFKQNFSSLHQYAPGEDGKLPGAPWADPMAGISQEAGSPTWKEVLFKVQSPYLLLADFHPLCPQPGIRHLEQEALSAFFQFEMGLAEQVLLAVPRTSLIPASERAVSEAKA